MPITNRDPVKDRGPDEGRSKIGQSRKLKNRRSLEQQKR